MGSPADRLNHAPAKANNKGFAFVVGRITTIHCHNSSSAAVMTVLQGIIKALAFIIPRGCGGGS
jgi:hypothetical protein